MPGYRLSCGYYSLGLTPTEAKEQLLENVRQGAPNAQRYKDMIAEELLEAVMQDDLPEDLNTPELLQLREEVGAAQQTVDEWARPLNAHLNVGGAYQADELTAELFQELGYDVLEETALGGMTVFDVLEQLNESKRTLENKITAIKNWAKQDQILEGYINAEINPGTELTFLPHVGGRQKSGIIGVLSEINRLSLNIYEPIRGNPQQLKLTYTHTTPNAVRQMNLLYSPGHFDRLEANLHRHVTPLMTFQDPFAAYKAEEKADDETVEAIGQELLNLDKELFPEGEKLAKELFNLAEYEGANKQAFIEGYIAQAEAEGRQISEQQAIQEYNKKKSDLEGQIEAGKKACISKKTEAYIVQYLMKASQEDTIITYKQGGGELKRNAKINPEMIDSALKQMGLESFPSIIYEPGFETYHQYAIDSAIYDKWGKGYGFFYLADDGLYGKKTEEGDFEKFLTFDGRKVEFPANPQDDTGIATFYTRTPDPKEEAIYDEMEEAARKLLKNADASVTYIKEVKIAFRKRADFLRDVKGGKFKYFDSGRHALHLEYCDPKHYHHDGVSAEHRLNNIHNSLIQPYLTAKKRGPENLKHFFEKGLAPDRIWICMDGTSRSLQDYVRLQEKGLDTDKVENQTKTQLIEQELAKLADRSNKTLPTEASIRARFMEFVGVDVKDGKFGKEDVDKAVQLAKDLNILD